MTAATVPEELTAALRSGPFHHALYLAIQLSGLTLQRIQVRLADRGHRVSLASLSYWQRGQSRPHRHASLRVLRELEEVLELPPRALLALLDRPAPEPPAPPVHPLVLRGRRGAPISGRRLPHPADAIVPLSVHEHWTVGPDRAVRSMRVRAVLQAMVDGVDRHLVRLAAPAGALPNRWQSDTCRLGRIHTDPDGGGVLAELRFDRPLRQTETCLADYELGYRPEEALVTSCERRFLLGCREYRLTVAFDPRATPAKVWRVHRAAAHPAGRDGQREATELRLGARNEAQLVGFDLGPGGHGISWLWR
ncbi:MULTISPECIES: hypothetical protein [unclassified Crossiella]|uniref:hypothetical protein n=1 Tax=unclassified Crossiella TaxID=2620835 RepID=UPI00200017A5|nr:MULTISPECIES: hypothetical protein [unclassified Crossiella]MCK2238095.1 hypothetical protein [Crossiella sp. S99.2]MCK2256135.1 hypothetical protein [Crossiella sp. S99.1]